MSSAPEGRIREKRRFSQFLKMPIHEHNPDFAGAKGGLIAHAPRGATARQVSHFVKTAVGSFIAMKPIKHATTKNEVRRMTSQAIKPRVSLRPSLCSLIKAAYPGTQAQTTAK
jgi:hypothetical protein